MAAGMSNIRLTKFSFAKTTPNPEFCIPASTKIVLLTASFFFTIIYLKSSPTQILSNEGS
tara:strand:+ start:1363 stop:1542 length:180 start_codon:yes stop_codon:yes gene_type:complete